MITIHDGTYSMVVTKGVYNQVYKSLGWHLGDVETKQETMPPAIIVQNDIIQPEMQTEDENITPLEDENKDEAAIDLLEKPVSEMTPEELKEVATKLGIDFSNVKKTKILRQMVRDKLS